MWAWGPCHSSYSLPLWWAHTTYNALWLHSHTPLVCTHSLWWPPTSDQPSRHQRLPQQQIWRANLMHWKSTLQYSVSYTLWPDILSSTYTGWFHQHQHNKKACQNRFWLQSRVNIWSIQPLHSPVYHAKSVSYLCPLLLGPTPSSQPLKHHCNLRLYRQQKNCQLACLTGDY